MSRADDAVWLMGELNSLEEGGVPPGRYGYERAAAWRRGRQEAVDELRAALAERLGDGRGD